MATPEDGPVDVPAHDVLAAGFPCQPFSKSGYQRGMDEARGTLFWNIARILEERTPAVVLLENVRNIAGPRHTHEWDVIIQTLREIGYRVSSTPSVFSPHFLPPSLGGTPQVRDRVFILGTYVGRERALAETDVPPTVVRGPVDGWNVHDWDADWILDDDASIPDLARYQLTADETAWVDVWDDLVQRMWSARGVRLPGFPLWADAWIPERGPRPAGARTPCRDGSPTSWSRTPGSTTSTATSSEAWKKANPPFASFPESRRKLEWQAQDTELPVGDGHALPALRDPRQGADLPACPGGHHPDVDHRQPSPSPHPPRGSPPAGLLATFSLRPASGTLPRTSRWATGWRWAPRGTSSALTLSVTPPTCPGAWCAQS